MSAIASAVASAPSRWNHRIMLKSWKNITPNLTMSTISPQALLGGRLLTWSKGTFESQGTKRDQVVWSIENYSLLRFHLVNRLLKFDFLKILKGGTLTFFGPLKKGLFLVTLMRGVHVFELISLHVKVRIWICAFEFVKLLRRQNVCIQVPRNK